MSVFQVLKHTSEYFAKVHSRDGSHLEGLDTMYKAMVDADKLTLPSKPIFYQKNHALQRRR